MTDQSWNRKKLLRFALEARCDKQYVGVIQYFLQNLTMRACEKIPLGIGQEGADTHEFCQDIPFSRQIAAW